MTTPTATAGHPWRTHWSTPTLAGKKIVLSGKMSKWEKSRVVEVIGIEKGEIVDEVTPETHVVVLLAAAANPPPAQKKAEQLNKKGLASIEVLDLADFYQRMIPTPDESLDMLRTGAAALERWKEFFRVYQLSGVHLAPLPTFDLAGLDLSDFPLGHLPLDNVDFRNAKLNGTFFPVVAGVNFDGATMHKAHIAGLHRCTFVGADAPGLVVDWYERNQSGSGECDFTRAKLAGATFNKFTAGASSFVEADLTDARMLQADFTGADFTRAKLAGSAIHESNLGDARFTEADLTGVDFALSSLVNADLGRANLRDATLFRADLTDARLDGADLTNANVAQAKLTPERLQSAVGRPAAARTLQPGPAFLAMEQGMRGTYLYMNFNTTTPGGTRHVVFSANLAYQGRHAATYWVHLPARHGHGPLTIDGPSLAAATTALLEYLGPHATLDVESVRPSLAKLQNVCRDGVAEAFGAAVPTAEERAASQAAAKSQRTELKKAMLAELKGGREGIDKFSARPADDFRKMDHFAKADLRQAALDGVRVMDGLIFNNAKLDGASLVDAVVGRADWKKISFAGATVRRAKIAANATGSTFRDATLDEVDFSGADLGKCDFAGAKITHCRFANASLRGADLSKAAISDSDFENAFYDEQTLLPLGFAAGPTMRWVGAGLPPHELEAEKQKAAAATSAALSDASGVDDVMRRTQRRDDFLQKVKQNVDKAKIDKAMKMLKAEKFELFVDVTDDHLVGVVKSQSDADLVYACRLASDGSYSCCTQNLNVCGGLRGSPCKHLLVLAIGLERSDRVPPETLGLWIASSRNRQTALDKDKMGEVLLRYKGAQVGEVDWRPTETTPEDFYAF